MPTPKTLGIVVFSIVIGAFTLAAAQQNKSAGSLTTQDYIDIAQLYARYNDSIDYGKAEAWAATFTPDGVFANANGHDALVKFAQQFYEKNGGLRRHWNTNLQITPAPEGASGSAYLMLLDVSTRPSTVATTGKYEDTLVKTPQGWRFKKRVTRIDAPPKPTQ
jgi:hypothetical protein